MCHSSLPRSTIAEDRGRGESKLAAAKLTTLLFPQEPEQIHYGALSGGREQRRRGYGAVEPGIKRSSGKAERRGVERIQGFELGGTRRSLALAGARCA